MTLWGSGKLTIGSDLSGTATTKIILRSLQTCREVGTFKLYFWSQRCLSSENPLNYITFLLRGDATSRLCAVLKYRSLQGAVKHTWVFWALCISVSKSDDSRPHGAIRSTLNVPISAQPKVSFSEFSCEPECKFGPLMWYHDASVSHATSWIVIFSANLSVKTTGPAVNANLSARLSGSRRDWWV